MKKLIGIFLSSALIISLCSAAFSVNAETTAYNIGDRPYATENSKSDIVVSSGENLSFYDDFIVKDDIESYNDTTPIVSTTAWKLQASTNATTANNSVTVNTESSNAYGGTGQSLKLTYTNKLPTSATPQGETEKRYYHRLTACLSGKPFVVENEFWDTVAIAFWVKTEKDVNIVVRCFDYSAGDGNQLLISKEIKLSAGEHIVEVPLSSLSVTSTSYKKGFDRTDRDTLTKLYYPEILIRHSPAFDEGETERDIYIDNMGFYNIASNGTKTVSHNGKATTKVSIDEYVQASENTQKIVNNNYWWMDCDAATSTTPSSISTADATDGVNANAYAGVGQSVKYTASSVYDYNNSNYNGIKTNERIQTSDKHGTYWGKDATLAIWVKSSRAIKVYAAAGDGKQDGNNFYRTDKEYVIPAGESILRIPVSDFNVDNPLGNTTTCDRAFTWKNIDMLRLYFKCASPRTGTLNNEIELYIDEIAVETPIIGDTNDDEVIDILDLIRIKKYSAEIAYTDMDLLYFDVGGAGTDENGYSIADGNVDGTDLTVMKKQLLGLGKVAIKPYSATAAETSLVATVSASWGFDTV